MTVSLRALFDDALDAERSLLVASAASGATISTRAASDRIDGLQLAWHLLQRHDLASDVGRDGLLLAVKLLGAAVDTAGQCSPHNGFTDGLRAGMSIVGALLDQVSTAAAVAV